MNFEIKNVFLTIEGKSIVNDVSIKVCPGEIVGLMGPHGAGKTSTFNLAVGNLIPLYIEVFLIIPQDIYKKIQDLSLNQY